MHQTPYVFTQLLNFIPKDVFDRLVKKYKGNAYVKTYSCWNHLAVMIWAQLTSRQSLRDIETSLRAHSNKLYRLGIGRSVSRNNIANANAVRNVAIYRELAQAMMQRTAFISEKDATLRTIRDVFGLNGFFAIDSSTVSLPLNKFSWSIPQSGCGGIKLHTMYDVLRDVPRLCIITGHEERDQSFMEDYTYEEGCFYMFDRLYFKTKGFDKINKKGAFFVTRLKTNVVFDVESQADVNDKRVLLDQTIRFSSRWAKSGYPDRIRRIRYYSPENDEVLEFISNNFELDAATIALLYRYRWKIETFFKWIKQHLRIKEFYGTSGNAVMTQIYVAYISFCVLALVAHALDYKGSLYDFSNLISVSLTEKVYLVDLIKRFETPLDQPLQDGLQLLLDF